MGFSVNPVALSGLPPLLDRRAEELDSCAGYLHKEAVIADLGPAVATAPLARAHLQVVRWARDACTGRADILRDRADAVRAVVSAYTSSDAASAAALNATMAAADDAVPLSWPQSPLPGAADNGLGPDVFDADWLVADQLRFPPDFRTEYPPARHWTTPLSLSHLERQLFERLGAFGGIATRLSESLTAEGAQARIAGDWPGCYASAYAFASCRDALHAVADNVRGCAGALGRVWTGRAAAACTAALVGDAGALDAIGSTLTQLAACYRPAAAAARDAATAVESLHSALADEATPAMGIGLEVLTLGPLVEIGIQTEQRLAEAYTRCLRAARTAGQLIG